MLDTIFFDLDDTLFDFSAAEGSALSKTLTGAGITPTAAMLNRYHEINAAQWRRLERGEIGREQVMTERFALLGAELGAAWDPAAICARYEGFLAGEHQLMPGAEAVLAALAPRYALYAATNGEGEVQRRRLAASGLDRFFRRVFISQEMGADKPGRAFFAGCFAAIPGFDPRRGLMVGDSLTSDIRGGRDAGLRTCWVNVRGAEPPAEDGPDDIVTALDQLPALCARLAER